MPGLPGEEKKFFPINLNTLRKQKPKILSKKKNGFKCDLCDHVNTSDNGLKINFGKKHKITQVDSDIPKEYVYVASLNKDGDAIYLFDCCDVKVKKKNMTQIYNEQT